MDAARTISQMISIDPQAMGPKKALEKIGAQLQKQYERWQPRARSKLSLDPTLDEVKKLCQSLRRNAKVPGSIIPHLTLK